ncbi:MAG: glycosyltransferase family 39 protein [Candidatus Levyibacteriota bacterium]
MKFFKKQHISFTHILFVLGIVIIIALSAITLFTQSIRLDESQSVWLSLKSFDEILKLTAEDVHVPLYGVLLHYWMQILGTDIVSVRSLSFIFYILTIPVLFILSKEAVNRQVAYVTTFFFALSPFILWYSFEARMYSLFTLVTCMAHLYFMRMVRSKGQDGKIGYYISLAIGIYTHYFFLLVILLQAIYALTLIIQRIMHEMKESTSLTLQKLINFSSIKPHTAFKKFSMFQYIKNGFVYYKTFILSYLLIVVGALILFTPWAYYVISLGSASNTQPLIPPPSTFNLLQTFVLIMFGFQNEQIQSILVSLWPISIILLFIIFTKRKKVSFSNAEYYALATFLPVALVFMLSYIKPIFLSRYLIFVSPSLFLLLSWTLVSFSKKIRFVSIFGYTVISILLLYLQISSSQTTVKEDYSGVSKYLAAKTTPSDVIGVSSPFTVYPIEYSYNGHARIDTIPQWNRFKQGDTIPAFSQGAFINQIQTYQKQYDQIYVVLSYDQGYEHTIRTYLDSHYSLTSSKTFANGIIVRSYKINYDPKITLTYHE